MKNFNKWLLRFLVIALVAVTLTTRYVYAQQVEQKEYVELKNSTYLALQASVEDRVFEYGSPEKMNYSDYIEAGNGQTVVYIISEKPEGLSATPTRVGNMTIFGDNRIDYDKQGETKVIVETYTYTDRGEKLAKLSEGYFEVNDTKAPIIEIGDETIEVTEGTEADLPGNVSVYDEIDGELKYSDTLENGTYVITSDYEDKPGDYEVSVTARDVNGNESHGSFTVKVNAKPVPVYVARSGSGSGSSGGGGVGMGNMGAIYCGSYQARMQTSSDWGDAQWIIDTWDTCFVYWDGFYWYVADHNYQGFYASMYSNDIYWKRSDGTVEHWVKYKSYTGPKKGWGVYGTETKIYSLVPDGQMLTQTCMDNVSNYYGIWYRAE